jgi:protein TonB
LTLSGLVFSTQLPDIKSKFHKRLAPQFAEILLDKVELEPIEEIVKKPLKKIEIPEVKKIVVKRVELKKAEIKQEIRQSVTQARDKAKLAGVLAFKDDLSDMREALDVSRLTDTVSLQRGSGEVAKFDRSLLTSKTAAKQANVNVSNLSRETGGVALPGRASAVVEAPVKESGVQTGAVRLDREPLQSERSIERVRKVFVANKGAIYAIYNRALRKNPSLLGKVVLELVIEPSGTVTACQFIFSEMSDEEMLAKLVRRVQLFDFGEGNVSVTKISYPVHFLPG